MMSLNYQVFWSLLKFCIQGKNLIFLVHLTLIMTLTQDPLRKTYYFSSSILYLYYVSSYLTLLSKKKKKKLSGLEILQLSQNYCQWYNFIFYTTINFIYLLIYLFIYLFLHRILEDREGKFMYTHVLSYLQVEAGNRLKSKRKQW